jgi:hypothetical protein
MWRSMACWLGIAAIATPVDAQQRLAAGATLPIRVHTTCEVKREVRGRCAATSGPWQGSRTRSAWPIAASAILPGSGQAMLSVDRALPYLAVEAFAWTAYVKASRDYKRRRDGYRDLASRVARAPFATVRPNGDFEYYERMTHYREAGRYDLVGGGGLEPETDSTTYNGAVWLQARHTYWADPQVPPDMSSVEWQRAITFYRSRAYDQLYRWSWTNAPVEYALFLDLIRESNDANRQALQHLGIVIANHVLSTVDAFITVRLARQENRSGIRLEGSLPLPRLLTGRIR